MTDHPQYPPLPSFGRQLGGLFLRSIPLIFANLGLVVIQMTDTVMVAQLGPLEFGSVGLGGHVASVIILFCSGVAQIVAPTISRLLGARFNDVKGLRRTAQQGIWLGLLVSIPLCLPLMDTGWLMAGTGQDPEISALTVIYLRYFAAAIPFMTVVVVLGGLLSALGMARWVMIATIITAVVNFLGNYILIFGFGPIAGLGVIGAALASIVSASAQCFVLIWVLARHRKLRRLRLFQGLTSPDFRLLSGLFKDGIPVGLILLVEVGFFTGAALIMGGFGADALAAHQVAIQMVTVSLMIALGVSQACGIQVGYAHGRQDRPLIRQTGVAGMVLIIIIMSSLALLFSIGRDWLTAIFIDPASYAGQLAGIFILIAAAFQIADGLQTVTAGALRGLADTRGPLVIAVICYWVIGIPAGLLLSRTFWNDPTGFWFAMAAALFIMAAALVPRFLHQSKCSAFRLDEQPQS